MCVSIFYAFIRSQQYYYSCFSFSTGFMFLALFLVSLQMCGTNDTSHGNIVYFFYPRETLLFLEEIDRLWKGSLTVMHMMFINMTIWWWSRHTQAWSNYFNFVQHCLDDLSSLVKLTLFPLSLSVCLYLSSYSIFLHDMTQAHLHPFHVCVPPILLISIYKLPVATTNSLSFHTVF